MVTANEAYKYAKEYINGIGKESFDELANYINCCIASEADTGYRGTYLERSEFKDVTGIEFVIDELRNNGFHVDVERDNRHEFYSMYVSW